MACLNLVDYSNTASLPNTSGLYFVTNTKEILYVGQSANLNKRWAKHHLRSKLAERVRSGDFLKIVWLPAQKALAEEAEKIVLRHLWPHPPKYNQVSYTNKLFSDRGRYLDYLSNVVSECGLHRRGDSIECATCAELHRLREEIGAIESGVNLIVRGLADHWNYPEFRQAYNRKGLVMLAARMPELAKDKLLQVEQNEKRIAEIVEFGETRKAEAKAKLYVPCLNTTLIFSEIVNPQAAGFLD